MFSCPDCNKALTRKYALKCHIKTVHKKERPYACDMCPKQLSTSGSLRRHKRLKHNDNKLFEIINNTEVKSKRFRYCDNQVTFRIKPMPKNMDPQAWFYKVFEGIINHFKDTYAPEDNDIVGLTINNSEFPNKDAFISMRKLKDLDVRTVINTLSNVCQSNADFKLIGDINVCYKHIKST